MKTNFFRIIEHLQSKGSWTIHIAPQADQQMIVSVLMSDPKSEKEGINFTPMIFNELPQVLDDTFFTRITTPVREISEVFSNFSEVQKSIEQAKKLLKEKSKPASPTANPKADDSAVLKQQYEEAIKKIEELNGLCKYTEALALLPDEKIYPEKQVELARLRKELDDKSRQLSLL